MSELTNRSVGASSVAAAGGAEFRWTRRHVLALTVLCLAALLDTIDVTVVNVAMPAIRNSLHFSEGGLAWMVDAYMVPFGGFLLLGGRTGDLLGRRRVLVARTAAVDVVEIEGRRPEIRGRIGILLLLEATVRIESQVVIDELSEIGIECRDAAFLFVGTVLRLIEIRHHRGRQFP